MGLGLRPQPVPSLLLQRGNGMFLVRKQQWCIDMSAACLERRQEKGETPLTGVVFGVVFPFEVLLIIYLSLLDVV